MVSTRKHPSEFAAPDESPPAAAKIASPTKRSTRSSSKASTPAPAYSSADESTAVVKKRMSPPPRPSPASRARARSVSLTWSHTPSTTIMVWLAVSLPLVVWDTGYVLGRPHTMPGGALHAPIWSPYALYGTVDYVYGFPAVEARDGFTAAQGWLNAIETALYLVYVWFAFYYGHAEEGATGARAGLLTRRKIVGREAGIALLIAYSAAIMTVSKTVLYGLNEVCSGFKHVGHNDAFSLITLWIIPNGMWIVLPTYMSYIFANELLQGLEIAAGLPHKKEQ